MGRVKVPRCDNCGAPVEFGQGVLEARCEYCGEVLIREFAPQVPAVAPQPAPVQWRYDPPATVARSNGTKLWPLLIGTVVVVGASGIASFASNFDRSTSSASEVRAAAAVVPEVRAQTPSFSTSEPRGETVQPKSAAAGTIRPRSTKPKTPVAPVPAPTPDEPPKPPPFNSEAAVAGLDAAKAKAEKSCKSTTVKSLFVQMGFGADGKNRGAALSDSKLNGTPEAKCVLKIFRAVSIPAFDPATKPSGLGRGVRL
jgi:hypothetical protein